ncbi:MAG: diguanylate cyclase [Armatimonadota bacterium]|nr:diguanylate cyclase [Armatimonadota bacterium]
MDRAEPGLSLKHRLCFYLGGILFATVSYILGLWLYAVECASWGDAETYRKIVDSLTGGFRSHQLTFFAWEIFCVAIALLLGSFFQKEVMNRRRAEEQANIDGLTGVYNHRFFQERLTAEIERANRFRRVLSIIMLDIDNFKHYNDTWGHQAGDKLLVLFAALCGQCIRSIDFLARYGGEEFIIILPETTETEAFNVAERIRQTTERETEAALGPGKGTTVSAGIACYPKHGFTRHALILSADAALYSAKRSGKNRTCIYESDQHRPYRAASSHVKSIVSEEDLEAIEALSAAVDAQTTCYNGHSSAVSNHAVLLGERLGLSPSELGSLRVAAMLHDIGTLGTPREILEKCTPLLQDEWKLIERHPGLGSRILARLQEMPAIGPAVRHHHERYDGKGYPNGLAGKEIPLFARIIAIADAYDAMTHPRPYRPALSQTEAIQELRRCAGTQFDPDLVEEFIAALEEHSAVDEEAA